MLLGIGCLLFEVITQLKAYILVFWSIIIIIYCNWVVTRWQWLFYVYTKCAIGYY